MVFIFQERNDSGTVFFAAAPYSLKPSEGRRADLGRGIVQASSMNPKALDKAEIISLLSGQVPSARVAEIVKEQGIKFSPAADDLNEIRAAGGTDELILAIQKATAHP